MPNLVTELNKHAPPSPLPPSLTAAEMILEQLRLWGVKRIYGVVGDAIFGLLDAIAKQEALSFIAVKHESAAAMMASAEAKLTGRIGVCIAQMGPGLANLINGLGDAFMDKAPVLAITGDAPLDKIGTSYKQAVNQQQLMQAVSSYSQLVVHPKAVFASLARAIQMSVQHQTVSHLSIPADVFEQAATIQPYEQPYMPALYADPAAIQQALQFMRNSKRPVMLVGSKAEAESEAIHRLAEKWGCAIAMSYGAIGKVPASLPFMLNGLGEGGNPFLPPLFKQADVVLALDTSWWPEGLVPDTARVIHLVNHPIKLGTSIPVNVGLVGDMPNIIAKLLAGLEQFKPDPDWIEQIRQCRQAWFTQNEKERNQAASPLHPANIVKIVEQNIAEDGVIALDEGDSTLWFLRNFRAKDHRFLLSERWRTMGFGLPAAIAAKLILPEKQIVCITGDGGLEMVMAELLTAVKYGLPITVIVFNNGTLQMEQDKMDMKGLQPEGTNLANPDFAKVAEACGWSSQRIETAEQLEAALKRSLSGNKPALLDVFTTQIPHPDFK
ncbi:thiamine pyrophosphate-binding protein [Paenibacillus sp. GCM10027626]|uniref:thiamine pyrophosphate-binding protein n=1 Tax=Paenibacillus sp. GCM10027626 TaxID=3273411 RepID=UPI003627738A